MKILVVYDLLYRDDRNTINEFLYSFERYADEECYYLNAAYGIPQYVTRINFDLIIFQNTFFSFRWHYTSAPKNNHIFKDLKGYKIALPQDECLNTDSLCDFFQQSGVKTVFTCVPQQEWQRVYPRGKSGLQHYFTVFAGYIDELALNKWSKLSLHHGARSIDVGYRARQSPFWLGRHGILKWQLTEQFMNTAVNYNLKLDLSNNESDAFHGDQWYEFLGNCRVVLGCEGGASLLDVDGRVKIKTEEYVLKHPQATFEEVESACFPGLDGNFKFFTLSPRHFEACITRTCQALVEGEYGGIFKPGVHYIEIKKDWSNMDDVMEQIMDVDFCERIADNAYRDIVEPGIYTYRNFVRGVLDHVRKVGVFIFSSNRDDARYLKLLERRERLPFVYSPVAFWIGYIQVTVYKMILKMNLYANFKKLEFLFRRSLKKN